MKELSQSPKVKSQSLHRSLPIRSECQAKFQTPIRKLLSRREGGEAGEGRGRATRERVEVFATHHFRYWFYIGFSLLARNSWSGDVFDFSGSRKKSVDPELVGCSFRKYERGARRGSGTICAATWGGESSVSIGEPGVTTPWYQLIRSRETRDRIMSG